MKVSYDRETDILNIVLRKARIDESDEVNPGVILDLDRRGNVIGIEILDASKRVQNLGSVQSESLARKSPR